MVLRGKVRGGEIMLLSNESLFLCTLVCLVNKLVCKYHEKYVHNLLSRTLTLEPADDLTSLSGSTHGGRLKKIVKKVDFSRPSSLVSCLQTMSLVCNVCYADLGIGIIYKTKCRHFLCPDCAKSSFTALCQCPVCQHQLVPGDVTELVAGCAPSPPLDAALQIALQDPTWPAILNRAHEIQHVAAEANTVLLTQALIYSGRASKRLLQLQSQFEDRDKTWAAHAHDLNSQIQHKESAKLTAEALASEREVQLQELDQLLQEQTRRCLAWEKAYASLRQQCNVRSSNIAGGAGGLSYISGAGSEGGIGGTRYVQAASTSANSAEYKDDDSQCSAMVVSRQSQQQQQQQQQQKRASSHWLHTQQPPASTVTASTNSSYDSPPVRDIPHNAPPALPSRSRPAVAAGAARESPHGDGDGDGDGDGSGNGNGNGRGPNWGRSRTDFYSDLRQGALEQEKLVERTQAQAQVQNKRPNQQGQRTSNFFFEK